MTRRKPRVATRAVGADRPVAGRSRTAPAALAALFALSCVVAPAVAQSPAQTPPLAAPQAPGPGGAPGAPQPGGAPGPTTEIIGPQGSFRLQPDGENWERVQTVRSIGVRCSEKSCGGERVFCLIQVRGVAEAKAGEQTSRESAEEFGAGVIRSAPKELKAEYVAPFAETTFGPNPGQWAEVKAEGEPGSLRFGLFLTKAEKHLVAFNCVSPSSKWDENKPKFASLLGTVQITK